MKNYLKSLISSYRKSPLAGRGLLKVPLIKKIYKFFVGLFGLNLVTVDNRKMYFDENMYIYVSESGQYEPAETLVVKKYYTGGNAVDIGANAGYYTLLFSSMASPGSTVYAFEPDPDNYGLLLKNIRLNRCANTVAEKKAVTDTAGALKLHVSELNRGDHRIFGGSGRRSINIEGVPLDAYFGGGKQVDFIKMDIQGAEALAIKGMKLTLQSNPGIKLLVEFTPRALKEAGSSASGMLLALEEMGFKFYDVANEKPDRPSTRQELLSRYPEDTEKYGNILCKRG